MRIIYSQRVVQPSRLLRIIKNSLERYMALPGSADRKQIVMRVSDDVEHLYKFINAYLKNHASANR
jgi:hypothetical protein